ncbi:MULTISPECIES: bifunctional 4-hydroxy-2-oxoglutarate aldolase/2-dehydro-3-deoxy-phosphogluconate aldolase [unclassified Thalassolituus]|mgnify:CR=1 FL=1|uniref:bifunctional 4-hydroxy-2-oxoglutarate aldolase/2-dehydro-3-deoxy-phosphogluconate aldolase n=1 Tax=unclassified Thalassolituus TaxID=2624967 RepID=UPI0025E23607|nr:MULTISPECIES: bifunctional 4-hydroxy-2-oxoglutarate aldolase/2-dehydro-3-deoxy-phosphogluconate aldolase [unclassified Thalassolituus]|tara:strand:+ start:1662 stop:2282 length:621 start_codon:yes stop_codon:yes gene_type:complete
MADHMWDLWMERAKPLVPVIVIKDPDEAVPLARALVDGGVRMLEVTLRTEHGLGAIETIKQEVPEAIVGVGTVTSAQQMLDALNKGAEFVVSPGSSDALLDCAKEWGGPYLPGVATPSDVMRAREAGFTYQKFFPAGVAGGIPMLKALSGPFGDVKFCPTGGIGQENYQDYLALSNVFAVGGSWLTPADLQSARNWQAISSLAIAG